MLRKTISLPTTIPYLPPLTMIWFVLSIGWMALEGRLGPVIVLGVLTMLIILAHIGQRLCGGRSLHTWQVLVGGTVGGGIAGSLLPLLIILLMTLKTGLHAHGAEFTPQEIVWVGQQFRLWGISGGLFGLGFSVLGVSFI
jgi:hypothetical protein